MTSQSGNLPSAPAHIPVRKAIPIKPLLALSYSSLLTFHSCPRKYLLRKALQKGYLDAASSTVDMSELDSFFTDAGINVQAPTRAQDSIRTEAQVKREVTFAYGKAVGLGVQSYLEGKDEAAVMLDMFCEWSTYLLDEDEKAAKSFAHAMLAVEAFTHISSIDFDIADYELVMLPSGRPACEMSFVIELPGGARYRGFIDAVLRNRYTGEIVVLECKTTGSKYVNASKYQNSEQALCYAIVLDKVFGKLSSYSVVYTSYLTTVGKWEVFKFPKTPLQRASWFLNTLHDLEELEKCIANDYFPMRGESCNSFMRDCDYLGQCHTDQAMFYGPDVDPDEGKSWDFHITLEELMEAQHATVE